MLEEIPLKKLYPFIVKAFEGDGDLGKYHIADRLYALHAYREIEKTAKILPLTYYRVGDFGFTVTSPGLLYSFGININHRDKETLKNWFAEITEILHTFEVVLHSKNQRAINHLVKQGMQIKEHLIVLIYEAGI